MKFAFQHLPKSAGTSFRAQLGSWLGDQGVLDVFDDRFLPTAEPARFAGAQLLCGHLSTGVLSQSFAPAQVITCMRDPIDRVVSQFYYGRTFFADHLHKFNTRYWYAYDLSLDPWEDLIRCLRHPEVPSHYHLRDLQTWYLGHHPAQRDISEPEVLARAKAWVSDIGCLGFMESYDAFLSDARAFLGLADDHRVQAVFENVNTERPRGEPVPASVKAEIESANVLDMELYAFAQSLQKSARTPARNEALLASYPARLTLSGMPDKLAHAKQAVADLCSRPIFNALHASRSEENYVFLAGAAHLQATEPTTRRFCEIRPRSGANVAVIARAASGHFELSCADFSDGGARIPHGDRIHEGFKLCLDKYVGPHPVSVHQTFAELHADCVDAPARHFDMVLTSLPFTSQQMQTELAAIESVLSDTGMVVIDDAFNHGWPHVTAGLIAYIERSEHLVPLGLHRNCLLLVRRQGAANWFLKCEPLFRNLLGFTEFGEAELCGKRLLTFS